MTFQSLDQIKKEFNFVDDDPKEMRKNLRILMADLHPDRHGGEVSTPLEVKEKFLKANEADQFLEKLMSEQTALAPVNETMELVKLVRDLALANKKENKVASFESRLSERIEQGIRQLGKQYRAPRITVSAITTALSFVWLLPGTFSEHPVLKYYVNAANLGFQIIWLTSLALTILVLFGTSVSEESQKRFQSRLKTETFQNDAFELYLKHRSGKILSKSQFVRFLTAWDFHRRRDISPNPSAFQLLFSQIIGAVPLIVDQESAQLISDLVFERAERRGFILKNETTKSLEDTYKLATEEDTN